MLNDKLSKITNEDFQFLVKNGKRTSILFNFDFESLIFAEWGLIKIELPDLFSKGDFEKIIFLLLKDRGVHVFLNEVKNLEIKEVLSFILWINDELKIINELEKNHLSSEPNAKMFQAGINKLDQFGVMNTIDNLANGNILDYEKVKKLKYSDVFDKQYREVITKEIQDKLSKLK